jgi:hypothetical protein
MHVFEIVSDKDRESDVEPATKAGSGIKGCLLYRPDHVLEFGKGKPMIVVLVLEAVGRSLHPRFKWLVDIPVLMGKMAGPKHKYRTKVGQQWSSRRGIVEIRAAQARKQFALRLAKTLVDQAVKIIAAIEVWYSCMCH